MPQYLVQVMEVDAFSSVHDMIHAAIVHYGTQATLRQVYALHTALFSFPTCPSLRLTVTSCRSIRLVKRGAALPTNAQEALGLSLTTTTGRARFVTPFTPVTGFRGEHWQRSLNPATHEASVRPVTLKEPSVL